MSFFDNAYAGTPPLEGEGPHKRPAPAGISFRFRAQGVERGDRG